MIGGKPPNPHLKIIFHKEVRYQIYGGGFCSFTEISSLLVGGRIPLTLRVHGILPPNQFARYFFQISTLPCSWLNKYHYSCSLHAGGGEGVGLVVGDSSKIDDNDKILFILTSDVQ